MSVKRIFDFVVSSILLTSLLPVIVVVAFLVRWRLGSPVIFRALRPGLHGKPFCMYKFRTMTNDRDAEGRPLPDKQRVTTLGEALRRSSLDELPQLVNVIKGDMSLVGPRPLAMEYLPLYNLEQVRRHHVKPGITGWAQVNGRSSISWTEKFKLDVWYVDHRSFWLDLQILFLTAKNVTLQHGVCSTGETKYGNFSGSN
ncbi:MAG: sugar transferase [Veillonellaceae bacterium]|nr:sugar transferase [Veillonellaceae bacterium]